MDYVAINFNEPGSTQMASRPELNAAFEMP